jgi:hypothetical protein
MGEEGLPILDVEIPQREAVAMAAGAVVTDLAEYQDLLNELRKMKVA